MVLEHNHESFRENNFLQFAAVAQIPRNAASCHKVTERRTAKKALSMQASPFQLPLLVGQTCGALVQECKK